MKISLNWIKQYLDLPASLTAEELAEKLTMSTVEVEDVVFQAKEYEHQVVAEILEIVKHPQADKLNVLKVNAGAEFGELQIVCGATNISKGMKGVLALPGAKVKWHGQGDWVILEQTKIRGIESSGMLCAPEEIGLAEEFSVDGVIELTIGKPGQPIAEVLGLDDIILEIDNISITHRPDLWGHYGIAREIAALTGVKLKELSEIKIKEGAEVKLQVKVEEPELCPRYQAVAIGGVKIQPSPLWLKQLLTSAGVRPINNIVDITNYVMLKFGQPIHAFDRRQILNDSLIVKTAKDGDKFITLDNQERELSASMLMIADAEKNLALAGIIGGLASGIAEDTTQIIIESANFDSISVRKTSAKLGLRTDASSRFEKSLDPQMTAIALNTVVRLVFELNPEATVISKIADENNAKIKETELELGWDFLFKRLGQEISKKEVVQILEKLQFIVKEKSDQLIVKVPSFRAGKDVARPEDLVEEIARIYGYSKLIPKLPDVSLLPAQEMPELKLTSLAKNFLAYGLGATEIYNYSFVSEQQIKSLGLAVEDHLELANYLNPESRYLRLSLFEGLVKNWQDNLRFYKEINLFEAGRIFNRDKGDYHTDNTKKDFLISQDQSLAGLLYNATGRDVFLTAKGLLERLLEHLDVPYVYGASAKPKEPFLNKDAYLEIKSATGDVLGWIGLLNSNFKSGSSDMPALWQLNLHLLPKFVQEKIKARSLPKYPGMVYDFSIIVPEKIAWAALRQEVLETSKLVKKVQLFDLYQIEALGPDLKSLSFHVNLLDETKTLTSAEGDKVKDKITSVLKKKFKAEIR